MRLEFTHIDVNTVVITIVVIVVFGIATYQLEVTAPYRVRGTSGYCTLDINHHIQQASAREVATRLDLCPLILRLVKLDK
jgi:hypothetical protein